MRVAGAVESGSAGIKYKLSGGSETTMSGFTSNGAGPYNFVSIPGPGTLEYLQLSRNGAANANSLVSAIERNGKVLVDTDASLAGAIGNTLSQTWLQWNGVATLRADNPEDVAKFEAIDAAFKDYEPTRDKAQSDVLMKLYEAGFTLPEVATVQSLTPEVAEKALREAAATADVKPKRGRKKQG